MPPTFGYYQKKGRSNPYQDFKWTCTSTFTPSPPLLNTWKLKIYNSKNMRGVAGQQVFGPFALQLIIGCSCSSIKHELCTGNWAEKLYWAQKSFTMDLPRVHCWAGFDTDWATLCLWPRLSIPEQLSRRIVQTCNANFSPATSLSDIMGIFPQLSWPSTLLSKSKQQAQTRITKTK